MFNFLFSPGNMKRKPDECIKNILEDTHLLGWLEKVCNLYDIESEEIETKAYFILKYAFLNGHCGLAKFPDGKYYMGVGTYSGELDADGYGEDYIITLQNGKTYKGKIGEDVVVLKWNNLALSQFTRIQWLAQLQAETDISIKSSIIYSRLLPIPIVDDTVDEKSIVKVIKDIFEGKLSIVKRASKRNYYGNGEVDRQNTFDITNPANTAYIQNLSRIKDELIVEGCREFGIYVSSRLDKGAQLNNKELSAFEDYVAISSDDTYNQLLTFAEECKKVFGIDVTVRAKNYTHTEEDVVDNDQYINGNEEDVTDGIDTQANQDDGRGNSADN